MKNLCVNKTAKVSDKNISYREMLRQIVESAPAEGFTVGDLRCTTRILDQLESGEDCVQISDSDARFLLKRVKDFRFAVYSRDFVTFVEDVEGDLG
jgi:hypothetical protein